ncbi:TetR/AcrR family transcriptional regulator [Amorphus orientalis]|uniref:AcrR family transcriptional regulator n=1 Tax=Amorphus orientalis TaxID=649198 RepID=A0AAE4ARI0_9HYPH|nr:TetR/AcrR family transcriptional regulator [Amorphus orientalis]MDQ0314232.1 AcrR family transcriptional regulator [Amorphus orientalis]
MATKRQRQSIVSALIALLETRDWQDIGLDDIAAEAGVSLAVLRSVFDTKVAILEAFVRDIDETVLAGDDGDMGDEPPRERLFDVLMRRLDTLKPYRPALRSLAASARRDPVLAASLNRMALVSQGWMLTSAGIHIKGLLGAAATQGLVVAFARVLRVFLREEDAGLPRTMAALDKELRRGERSFLRLERVSRPIRRGVRRRWERPASAQADPEDPAGAASSPA